MSFWKCWKAKFEKQNKASRLIDGLADDTQIAEAFAKYFRTTCTSSNEGQSNRLRSTFSALLALQCRNVDDHTCPGETY